MKDRFTREKAGETIYETQSSQSRLITETVFCELKGQCDSINKIDVYYDFFLFALLILKNKITSTKTVAEQAYQI